MGNPNQELVQANQHLIVEIPLGLEARNKQ